MRVIGLIALVFMAHSTGGQDIRSATCGRIIGHTPFYERILLPKGNLLRPSTLRGVDDLGPEPDYPEAAGIDRIFADASRERTNGFFISCLSELPSITSLSLRCPGALLDSEQIRELLRDTVAVPRSNWTNHVGHGSSGRYVFSLVRAKGDKYVVDERAGACALVLFPDGTYRCVMDPNYWCLKKLQQDGPANGSQPIRSETNSKSSAAGSRR